LKRKVDAGTEFYEYAKRRKGNRENIPAIRDHNGKLITDPIEKANSLNPYYAPLFSCDRNTLQMQSTQSCKPFAIGINMIRKRLSAIGRKKSVGLDGVPGEILKLGVEVMIPYLAGLLNITVNNSAVPGDWKEAVVVPIYKGGIDRYLETTDWAAYTGWFANKWSRL
jgi:hypothetical protein